MICIPNILIVEDEAIIALGLELAAIDSGARVSGPFATTAAALAAIADDPPQGAILDANLWDGPITPVARWLISERIPVVLHSAQGMPGDLAAEFSDLPSAPKMGVFLRMMEGLAAEDADATYLKAHRTASSLRVKKGISGG